MKEVSFSNQIIVKFDYGTEGECVPRNRTLPTINFNLHASENPATFSELTAKPHPKPGTRFFWSSIRVDSIALLYPDRS